MQLRFNMKIILLAFTLLLTGCGFHLRGVTDLPPQLHNLYFTSVKPYSEFSRELKMILGFSHVNMVNYSSQAPITLSITNENFSYTETSVASSDRTRNYSTNYTATYIIQNANGRTIVGPISVSATSSIIAQPNEIIDNSNKLNIVKQSSARDLALKMMFQLTSKRTITALNKAIPMSSSVKHENKR